MTAPELKPCPFCGAGDPEWLASHVVCECGATGPRQNVDREYQADALQGLRDWNHRADIAGVPAQVRVKPLVWGTFGKECLRAETVLGRYEVMWGFHNGQTSLDIPAPRRSHVWHPSVEAAQAAAQADYEARILAAIEPVPDPTCCLGLTATDCADVPSRHCAGPQPDPRDEVFRQLECAVTLYEEYVLVAGGLQAGEWINSARAALAAAKAVQHG